MKISEIIEEASNLLNELQEVRYEILENSEHLLTNLPEADVYISIYIKSYTHTVGLNKRDRETPTIILTRSLLEIYQEATGKEINLVKGEIQLSNLKALIKEI